MKRKVGYGRFVKWALLVSDVLLFVLLYYAISWIMHCTAMHSLVLVAYAAVVMACVSYAFIEVHELRVLYADKIAVKAFRATIAHAVFFVVMCLIVDARLPWSVFLSLYGTMFVALFVWWFGSRKLLMLLRGVGFNYKRVVVFGSGVAARQLIDEFMSDLGYGYRIMGYFDNQPSDKIPSTITYLGDMEQASEYISGQWIDEIYFEKSGNHTEHDLERVMNLADASAIDFFYLPQLGSAAVRPMEVINMGKSLVLSVRPTPLSYPLNAALKRGFDILFSSVVLLLSPIVLIPVAIGVKLSSKGPVFFKQERTGYRGKSFYCYKFRSMRLNAESDSLQATSGDPRKTKFGEFLRKSSIDELPQFYNVWKGDMSIVGPRPHMLAHTEMYSKIIDKYMMRHTVKPGITGWAQVRGFRGPTPEVWMMEKRVEYDVWYAENWNFMLDLKIIFLTIINVFRGDKNAL